MRNDTSKTYQEAIQCMEKDQQEEAIKEEFDLHQINKTWELTKLFQGQKILPSQQIYKKKYTQQMLSNNTRHVKL